MEDDNYNDDEMDLDSMEEIKLAKVSPPADRALFGPFTSQQVK